MCGSINTSNFHSGFIQKKKFKLCEEKIRFFCWHIKRNF